LALIAGQFPQGVLLHYIPNLSVYRYQKARRIARSGKFYPMTVDHQIYERYDTIAVNGLISLITSPLVLMGLPWGEKTVTTSSGEVLTIPNTVRMMSQAEIVRQFPLFMAAQGEGDHTLSPSSIIRLLNSLPATASHSMTCVDSFLAKANYAFEDLLRIVDRLHEMAILNKDAKIDWRNNILEDQLYLKTDFKLHLKHEPLIANHCLTFALSDPDDPAFRKTEDHQHTEQCPRCTHLSKSFTELLEVIADASAASTSDSMKKELAEMHFRVKSHQEIIKRQRNHEIRAAFTSLEREGIIDKMENRQCLVTTEFATKFLSAY
ncbi:hypothetical protein PMAYCL1PPCAC_05053, partial [Pristionchus mayeri]